MKKITIGMPVYNGADFLPAAVESILAQRFGDFELIISDNASTDATEQIGRAYASSDSRVRFVRQPRNVGAAANHNLLVRQSESRYFKWAAHDDVLGPDFLGTAFNALEARPDVVIASPASALIDESGEILSFSADRGGIVDRSGVCWPVVPEENPGLTASSASKRFTAVMLKMVMCVEIFGLMRRSALERTGLQGPFSGADKVLLAEMALLGPFWLGDDVHFFRRCHGKQFSAMTSGAARALWFSGRQDSLLTQQLKLFAAYCRSVSQKDLTLEQRASCFSAILRRALFRGNHFRRLVGGLVGNP